MRREPSDFKSKHEEAKGGKRWRMKASPKVRPALPRPSVYSTNLTPPPKPPYPPLDSTIYKIKNFLYSGFHSAVPPSLQGQTTQVITNKWSEVNKTQSPN